MYAFIFISIPEKYLLMSLDEKRKVYKCGDKFMTLDDIQTWEEEYLKNEKSLEKKREYMLAGSLNSSLLVLLSPTELSENCLLNDALIRSTTF